MPLSAGDKLGPYEILSPIGAGGMGEVYRARDPRVGRAVAIKVSNERFGERFERYLVHPDRLGYRDRFRRYWVLGCKLYLLRASAGCIEPAFGHFAPNRQTP